MNRWPTTVEVVDVTPRDGLQDAKGRLTTSEKITLVEELFGAGVARIEAVSFVSPKWVPTMADAEDVLRGVGTSGPVIGLVPNLKGFERAAQSGIREITYVVSASPIHQDANLRMPLEQSLFQLESIMQQASTANIRVRGAISCAFGSPFDEAILGREVAAIAGRLVDLGVVEIGLADTVGIGTPQVVADIVDCVQDRIPDTQLAIHLHDRYGLGQANVVTAMSRGIATFEAALGGLGGCPFAPNAPGNLDLESLVGWLEAMGIETGVNLEAVAKIRQRLLETLHLRESAQGEVASK